MRAAGAEYPEKKSLLLWEPDDELNQRLRSYLSASNIEVVELEGLDDLWMMGEFGKFNFLVLDISAILPSESAEIVENMRTSESCCDARIAIISANQEAVEHWENRRDKPDLILIKPLSEMDSFEVFLR